MRKGAGVRAHNPTTRPEAQDNSEIAMLPTSPTLSAFGAMGVGAGLNGLKNAVVMDSPIAAGVSVIVQKGYKNSWAGKVVATVNIPFASRDPEMR